MNNKGIYTEIEEIVKTDSLQIIRENYFQFPKGESNIYAKDVENKIVWGRDDVSKYANQRLHILRGLENDPVRESYYALNFGFNVKTGLLNYTKQLLNASEGKLVDITRKAFDYGDSEHGFNGSALWVRNDSKYATESGTPKFGVRQHTVLDPYNRFTKTIRASWSMGQSR